MRSSGSRYHPAVHLLLNEVLKIAKSNSHSSSSIKTKAFLCCHSLSVSITAIPFSTWLNRFACRSTPPTNSN
ncbi:hypothetical protein PGT21_018139 [Puccinia graminis f. sp. tritici]|uniref:Uncharacterized protein n=1 Tax=Puccinia graminis f. sp. tritici TaxID=56615 RepID=A0A5B0RIB1_PUCGR|nr:hypothetical protein PGT21_018139 [Puccinia graminis f. sp. tritici]KAA1125500.1 hypothetical protein PGTUg99_008565 [Puccinia graminis f. sp. tritici]